MFWNMFRPVAQFPACCPLSSSLEDLIPRVMGMEQKETHRFFAALASHTRTSSINPAFSALLLNSFSSSNAIQA